MRVAIIGSRDYQWVFSANPTGDSYQLARSNKSPYAKGSPCPDGAPLIQHAVRQLRPTDFVVTGGATGADYWGEHYARLEYVSRTIHEADWYRGGTEVFKGAGPVRNAKLMNDDIHAVLAYFSDRSKSRGTVQAIGLAEKAQIPVFEFDASREDSPSWLDNWHADVLRWWGV